MKMDNNIFSINFKIISFNVRGLNNKIKHRKSLRGFISKPLTAIFPDIWELEWGRKI